MNILTISTAENETNSNSQRDLIPSATDFFDDSYDLLSGNYRDARQDETGGQRPATSLSHTQPSQLRPSTNSNGSLYSTEKSVASNMPAVLEECDTTMPLNRTEILSRNGTRPQTSAGLPQLSMSPLKLSKSQSIGNTNIIPEERRFKIPPTVARPQTSSGQISKQPEFLQRPGTSSRYDEAKASRVGGLSVVARPESKMPQEKSKPTTYTDVLELFKTQKTGTFFFQSTIIQIYYLLSFAQRNII